MDTSSQPRDWDLLQTTPAFLIILFLSQYVFKKYILGPIGQKLHVGESTATPPPSIPSLENVYEIYGSKAVPNEKLTLIGKQEGLTTDKVKEWLALRRQQDEEPELDKFAYECWTALYYLVLNSFSCYVMPRKTWFWEIDECWTGYPNQKPDSEMSFFFTLAFSFFISDLLTLMHKTYERKDFYAIRIHHFFSIMLMVATWYTNMVRLGCLLLFLMELASPFPYISRIGWRLKLPFVSDVTFVVFAIAWVVGRVVLLHFWVIPSYVHFRYSVEHQSLNYFTIDFLLLTVLSVNAWWTYAIIEKFFRKFQPRSPVNTLKGLSTALAQRGD